MPRFVGDSFKVTPMRLNAENKNHEKISFVSNILNKSKFVPDEIPSSGWISFQSAREKIDANSEICTLKFSDGNIILPCTTVRHILISQLKRKLPPSIYDNLPPEVKYGYVPIDVVFFEKDKKLYTLISSNNQKSVDIAISHYFKDKPFSEYGFVIDKNPIELQIHSDLIHWLLYRFFEKKQTINTHIFIKDADLIEGNARVKISMKYEGKDIPKYLSELKYSISQNRPFEKIGLKLEFKKHIFEFIISSDGCTEFYASASEYLNLDDDYEDDLSKLTYIYTEIIPEIKKAYQADKSEWHKNKDEFLKKMGQDAIRFIPK